MSKTAVAILLSRGLLSGAERRELESLVRRRRTGQGLALRARIVLAAADVEKVRDIVGLSLAPPERALVLCVDEKSQVQALDRSPPLLPMRPGWPERRSHGYKRHGYKCHDHGRHNYGRHGTTTLFAALDRATGAVIGRGFARHRAKAFLKFLRIIEANVPADLDVHLVMDNDATHKTPAIHKCFARHPRWHIRFTPTGVSWLNQVERFFTLLSENPLRRGVHRCTREREEAILTDIDCVNADPKPVRWTKSADDSLASIKRFCLATIKAAEKQTESVRTSESGHYDLVVVGGGNAGLCAAITAREAGARVLLLEGAPKTYRGGNSRHTRNFRCLHHGPLSVLTETYSEEEYYDDLIKVTGGQTDEALARLTIRSSEQCLPWMEERGVRFQPSLSGTLSLSRTNAFFMGGGKALVNAYYRTAQNLGVEVIYGAQVTHLELEGDYVSGLEYTCRGENHRLEPKSIVVASGGFQADTDWLARAWGPAAENFLIRGTPYNRGAVLKDLLDQGVLSVGDPTQCHAVAIDGRAPKFDGGIVTRLDCVVYSIVVNKNGDRFYDEGEDVWPKRYAIWGRLVAGQPDQIGYAIIDSKSLELFMPSVFPPIKADSIEELADKMGLPKKKLRTTLDNFNAACGDDSGFHPTELDGLATAGIDPPKTNWARRICDPPFYGYSLRTGVTFTYLGLKVDENAQTSTEAGKIENLWAAGETMAGSILGQGYLAGFGMTIGTVFGRIAGREAAAHAN